MFNWWKVYDVPKNLQWAIGTTFPTVGEEYFERDSKRLILMAQTLVYGMTKLQGTYGVWSVWGAFRGKVGRGTIANWARLFQAQGILTMTKWENKPRVINVQEAKRFIDEVQQWIGSGPRPWKG
jgi:hypothetical protein